MIFTRFFNPQRDCTTWETTTHFREKGIPEMHSNTVKHQGHRVLPHLAENSTTHHPTNMVSSGSQHKPTNRLMEQFNHVNI